MGKFVDLTGQKFGRLTVIERDFSCKGVFWFCICNCNPDVVLEKSIQTERLTSENHGTKSCGCIKKFKEGEASLNMYFYTYKRNAIARNCFFDLEKEDFRKIVLQYCHYCNIEPRKIQYDKTMNGPFIGNGVDQIIASGGYSKENCVPCCWNCNGLKSDLSLENWNAKLKRIKNKDYDNLIFDYNFQEVPKALLKLQRGNFRIQKRTTKNQINTLTEQQYYYLATFNCFYCDMKPDNFQKNRSKDFYQGQDRKNNDIDYIFLNCLPCCHSCNTAKSDMFYDNFIEYLKRLQQFQKSLMVVV